MPALPLVSALGCAVTIDPGDRSAGEIARIQDAWVDAEVQPSDPLPARHVSVTVAGGDLEGALAALSTDITVAALEARRGALWMLHAGAVADDAGRVVAVVGPSGRGKTTATTHLGRAYGYVSDETLAVAADGTVVPYRKPLSVQTDATREKTQSAPSTLGLRPLPDAPLRLSGIVILDRNPGGPDEAELTLVDAVDALPELVEQSSYLADLPAPLRTITALVESVGGVHRVHYREASSLAAALAPLFTDAGEPVLPGPLDHAASAQEIGGDGWFRGAFIDAARMAARPDEAIDPLALLRPEPSGHSTLRIVAGIGPTVWQSASGLELDDIARQVVAEHGHAPHHDTVSVVAAVTAELERAGVLAREVSWRVRDDVAWTGEADRYVALALSLQGSPQPIALEGTAALIWSTLVRARGATSQALIDEIAREAGVEAAFVRADVRAFLASLEAQSLAERYMP